MLQARDLLSSDPNGKSDPYCTITVGGSTTHKTDVQSSTLNPVWKQSVVFLSGDLEPYATFRGALTRVGGRLVRVIVLQMACTGNRACHVVEQRALLSQMRSSSANRLNNYDGG